MIHNVHLSSYGQQPSSYIHVLPFIFPDQSHSASRLYRSQARMKRAKRSRTTTDSEDLDEVSPSDTTGDTIVTDVPPVKVLGVGGADGETQANPPKKRGRPPKQKGPQDGKEIHGDGKALLPEGCEVPVEVTPVLLIKNVFNAQGESVADEGKGEVLPGDSLQLLASVDAKEDASKKPKVTPRRGRPPLVKKADEDVEPDATKQEEKTKQKEVRRGRPPKYKTRKDSVDTVEEDGNDVNDKSDVLPPKKTGSDGEESEKVLPLENSQPRVAKRGRPPKCAHTSLDSDKSGPVENTDTSAEADLETASPPKKRGRGRPPKNRLSEDQANSAQKKPAAMKSTPLRDADTPADSKSSEVKKKAGRPRKTTENTESTNDTPAREPERKSDVAANIPLTDSASARRSRQLKAKKIFEDYEEYSPGKTKPKVAPFHMTPPIKKVKKVSHGTPGRPVSKQVPVKALDKCSVNDSTLDDNEMTSPTSGTSENDTSEGTEVFSIDPSNKSADHKQPSAAQVIIIKSKPKTDGNHDNSKLDGQEVEKKTCEKPAPPASKQKNAVESMPSKQTKVLPAQNRLPRQQRSARIPAKRQQQIASFKAEMCMAPEIKLDLPVGGLLDSVNMSTQPEIRTLYMFQNTSTNGWLKIICKRISGVQFYQCPLCPYKDPVPRKVADHLHEDHPSLVSIAEGKCTRIFATFLFMFCRHCDFIAYEKLALWYHFEQYHGLTDMINAKPIDPATINMTQFAPLEDYALKNAKIVLRCNECDFLSLSKRQAMLHVLKEHSGMTSCIGNGFVIISQLDAMSPPGEEGPPPSDVPNLPEELKSMVMKDCFICTECTFVTYKRALMEIHCVNNHAKRLLLLVCSVCGDQFDTTYKMSSHIATAHSESKRQFCTVTLVDAEGKEDVRLHELAELRSGEAVVAAASHEPADVPAVSVDQPETKPVTTAQSQPWLTDAKSSPASSHNVSTVTMTHQAKPAKTRPVAIVSGSSCGQPPVQKVWPGQSLVKPQQQAKMGRSADTVTSPSKQKATQLQASTQHIQIAPNTLTKPMDGEKQLTYIQMPDGTHHQVELTESGDGQLQYVLTNQRENEVAADGDQMCYVKLPDGSIQQLSSVADGSQAAENAEEIRYLQLPDGSLQQLPAETETGGEVHYVQLADGSLQQISSIPDTVPSTEPVQEVHYMKFPDGSLQQVTGDTQSAENDKNVQYVTLEDNAQSANETGSGEQVHYGKLSDGSVQQLAESGQSDSAEKAAESGQEMHCIKLADGSLQPVTESGQEVCYVKMPDGSIQQVAESVKGENGDGNVRSSDGATDGKTVTEHTEDGEQTTYVQYIIQMDNNEPSTATGEPQVAPPPADRSKFTAAQTSGANRVAVVDQSSSSSVAESRSEGTKMVSLLSQDVLANVQAHQTVAAATAPTEPGTQPMVMQAYNVNGETIILCCEPGMVITDQQAAQVIQAAPREAGSTTTSGQRILYVQNESTTGNFEDAFQTFVNSNSTQQ